MDITTVDLGSLAQAVMIGFFTLGILFFAGFKWILR